MAIARGKKTASGLFWVSACQLYYTNILGRLWKKFPFTVTPLCCSESCLAEMQTWRPPVGVCDDCVVLLLHWALGSAEWAEGQKHSEGDDPWASCHKQYRPRGREREGDKFSWNSGLLVLRYTACRTDTDNQWHFHTCVGERPSVWPVPVSTTAPSVNGL